MKNTFYLLTLLCVIFSCADDSKYVTFSGNISNQHTDSIIVFNPKSNYTKVIRLNSDGAFTDTLKVVDGIFSITNSKDVSLLYLINGDKLVMNLDANNFNESIEFIGDHAAENKFLGISMFEERKFFSSPNVMRLPKNTFDTKIASYTEGFNKRLQEEDFDETFVNSQKEEIINFKNYLGKEYNEKNYSNLVLGLGKPSPKFNNFENYNGGTTSLNDFKGKYVYIDVWATWCNPCKVEIPYLQKIEKEYHGKNIEFVSISIDDNRAYSAWKQMVKDKNLGGIQLYAKGDKTFTTAYRIRSIPRFMLIDPNGNIVNSNAPRPSSPELRVLLNSLNFK